MIIGLHHIAIIASTEQSILFYKRLGFKEISRTNRGYDEIVILAGYDIVLEIFIDDSHPPRADRPEALGLRHIALIVENIEKTLSELKLEEIDVQVETIREANGNRWTFFKDPDGLPIELREG